MEWHRCSTNLQIVRLDVYVPYEHATRAGCKRSHTEVLRCVPGNSPTVNRITGMHAAGQVAGCGAQLRTARCAGRNSQNRGQRICFAAVGWDGASWTRLSHHLTPARAQAPHLAPNRHVPRPTQRTHATWLWVARWFLNIRSFWTALRPRPLQLTAASACT
jgi:hypothetical protein